MTEPKIARDYEGRQEGVRQLELPPIEVWENKYADRDYEIELVMPEFNAICPKTGLPDFGTIRLRYCPDRWCAELKSFKLYITAYRNIGIFQEHAANKILEDFVRWVKPRWAELEAVFNVRGGIETRIRCAWPQERTPKPSGQG